MQYLRVLPFTCLLSFLLVSLVVIYLIFHTEQVQTEEYTAMYEELLSASEKVLVFIRRCSREHFSVFLFAFC